MAAIELYSTPLFNDANLVAYYRLESDGTDTKGTQNLTVTGSPSFVAAKFGNGVDLGASNSTKYLNAGNNLGIGSGNCSISAWVKIDTELSGGAMRYEFASVYDATTQIGYALGYDDVDASVNKLRFYRKEFGIANYNSEYTVSLGTVNWHHLVLTYDGSNINGYLDGSAVGTPYATSGNGSGSTALNEVNIGTYKYDNSGAYWLASAIIDDVAFFNRVLTPTEISNLYNGTWTQYYSPLATLGAG